MELADGNREPVTLFAPGPVGLTAFTRIAAAKPIIHHRSAEFRDCFRQVVQKFKRVLGTQDRVFLLSSSGTGAMEAAILNLRAGLKRVLIPVCGKFSRRWKEICDTFGVPASIIEYRAGESPETAEIISSLETEEQINAVLLTHCETSTGALTDLKEVANAIYDFEKLSGREILTCVDCVSSFCVDELRKDEWGIDCVIGASQKGLLSPAGLSFVSLSERCWRIVEGSPPLSYYFDLRKYERASLQGTTPFTPPISIIRSVDAALGWIIQRGIENLWKDASTAASAIRTTVEACGFRIVARKGSNAVVAFWMDDFNASKLAGVLLNERGIYIAQGQEELLGKILRVSPIGKTATQIKTFARAFAEVVNRLGREVNACEIESKVSEILGGSRLWE